MNFKSLIQLLDHFKDEKTCIKHYDKLRWNGKPVCPHCGSNKPYVTDRGYKCSNNECYKKFTVKVGTIFENSKIPFRVWFGAIYLATTTKKGISSIQLSTQLNITQKTAWYVLHRIREMLRDKEPKILGENNMVEADETYVGGKDKNRHTKKKQSENIGIANDGTVYNEKKVVIGIIERNGKVVLKYVPNAQAKNMVPFIEQHVPKGYKIYTDEHNAYSSLKEKYSHATVNHSLKIYVAGDVHTNTIENFWSVLKRGLYGIYHQVSYKHLDAYLAEFAGRFNTRDLSTEDRFNNFLSQSEGGLLYKNLTAND